MNKPRFKLLLVKVALAIFALAAVRGEAQVLTLVPIKVESNKTMTISADRDGKPDGLVALTFKSDAMPAGVTIANVALVMNIQDRGNEQTIKVYVEKTGQCTVRQIFQDFQESAFPTQDEVPPGRSCAYALSRLLATPRTDDKAQRATWQAEPTNWGKLGVKLNDGFTLILAGTGGYPTGRKFYGGLDDAQTKLQPQLRPRLVVGYTSSDQPTVAQPASVQSGKGFLPSGQLGGSPGSYRAVALNVPQEQIWSYAPAFYNGFVYLMSDVGGKKYLSWRRPLGAIVDQMDISSPSPGQHLLVSKWGHLYIVGDGKIIPYRIGSDGKPERRTVSPEGTPTDVVPVPVSLSDAKYAPTLGADGSMFYVAQPVAKGYTVEGRNPDLQELWSVGVKGPTSRVMLGPSGKYVYVMTKREGLVTIDARTGEKFVNPLSNGQALNEAQSEYLQTPVAFKENDGTEKVYVAADLVDSGVLTLFKNNKTKNGAKDNATIEKGEEQPALMFGQPLVTTGKDYVVRVDSTDKNSAYVESLDRSTGAKTKAGPPLKIATDNPYLPKGGNLATDKDGNVFAWNGNIKLGDLVAFKPSLDPLFTENLTGQLEPDSNLFFGTDGTLYAGAQKSTLRAIVPYYSLAGVTSPVTVTSPTHLWVAGAGESTPAILKGTGNTLTAAGSVMLGPNFGVEKNATLTVTISK
jgi:hypothetical protein